jgi:hypothetical protein
VRSDASRIEHFDGAKWTETQTGLAKVATAVWCAAAGDVWAVGSDSSVIRHQSP